MKRSVWLSVVMPTYNGARFVSQALESIALQGDEGVECIVVDDGSSDDTRAIVGTFSNRLNLRLVGETHRGNWMACSNDGLRLAQGQYACFLHQDDFWLPGRVGLMRALIDQNPGEALYIHAIQYVDDTGQRLGRLTCPLPSEPACVDSWRLIERLLVQNFIAINAPIFETVRALDLGGLDETLWYTADWDLWLKIASQGRTVYSPSASAAFRIHGDSQTVRGSASADGLYKQLSAVLSRHTPGDLSLPPDVLHRAHASASLNVALAQAYRGSWRGAIIVAMRLVLRGPLYCYRFVRDTRIHQRLTARVKARSLHRHNAHRATPDVNP